MIEQAYSIAQGTQTVERDQHIHQKTIAGVGLVYPNSMGETEIRRYERPAASAESPLEYAYHLLGGLEGKTVVDLGCGEGLNTVILARLGAKVLAIDNSEASLDMTSRRAAANRVAANVTLVHSDASSISVRDSIADHVLCVSSVTLQQYDPVLTARQIRRILRPGGTAIFKQPLALPRPLRAIRALLSDGEPVVQFQQLSFEVIEAVSRAVGRPGRSRAFWLTTRLLLRSGCGKSAITRALQRFDASLLHHFPSTRQFASPLVWEARKES